MDDNSYLTDKFNTPWPLVPLEAPDHYTHAKGIYLYKSDGQRVLDGASGAVVANIGHGRKQIADVAGHTLETLTYVHPEDSTPQRLTLIERLREKWLPDNFSRMMFTNGGGEAIEAAIKAVIHYHEAKGHDEKKVILAQDIAYHGATYLSYSLSSTHAFYPEIRDFLKPFPRIPVCRRVSLEEAWDNFVAAVESVGSDKISAIFAEPIVGSSGGVIVPPDEYWGKVKEYCKEHDILLVFDEIMTGFGRTGANFAFEHWNTGPDILVAGKGLGCGYAPVCGMYLSDSVAEILVKAGRFIMSPTYGAHNMSCAVANEALTVIEEENLLQNVRKVGTYLGEQLQQIEGLDLVAEVRGKGLFWGVEIAQAEQHDNQRTVSEIASRMLQRGIYLYTAGRGTDYPAVMIAPPFIITEQEIDFIVTNLNQVITELSAELGITPDERPEP
nr:aminotransferase class III-fold pyridoxal phosphate-dependent enzyme [Cytophagales bacterium]